MDTGLTELPGFPGYAINKSGGVFSRWRRGPSSKLGETWRNLTPVLIKGHGRVRLRSACQVFEYRFISRLVLTTFVGPCPEDMEACHKNGNPLDDRLDNLRWGTHLSNMEDKVIHGTLARGSKIGTSKLTAETVLEIRRVRKELKLTYKEIGARFEIDQKHAQRICTGASWSHLPVY